VCSSDLESRQPISGAVRLDRLLDSTILHFDVFLPSVIESLCGSLGIYRSSYISAEAGRWVRGDTQVGCKAWQASQLCRSECSTTKRRLPKRI